MNKKDRKELSRRIKHLPEMLHKTNKVKRQITGAHLLADGQTRTSDNKPITADLMYLGSVAADVNHRTEAEKAYKLYGMSGVIAYCQEVERVAAEQLERVDRA